MNIARFEDNVYHAAIDECFYLSDIVPSIYYVNEKTGVIKYRKIPNDFFIDEFNYYDGIINFLDYFNNTFPDVEHYSILMLTNEYKVDVTDLSITDTDTIYDDEGNFDMDIIPSNTPMRRVINICDYGSTEDYPKTRRLIVNDKDRVIGEEELDYSLIDNLNL